MKKTIGTFLCVTMILSLCSCSLQVQTIETTAESELTPTGISSGMLTPPQVKYNGKLYFYRYTTPGQNGAPDGYEKKGQIQAVDNYNTPSEDMYAGGAEIAFKRGQDIYASDEDDTRICVHCDDGYYLFYKN
ncbi:MAG: hypothetical protein J6U54_21540 [Clostridiales bacterium]|nr:hypothetical protein [Clostridiales bacterium]